MELARRFALAVVVVLLAASTACGGDEAGSGRAPVVLAGQSFTEADIVNQLYAQLLEKAGFRARIKKVGARQLYLGPLGKGAVQLAADNLSATTEQLNRDAHGPDAAPVASADVDATHAKLTELGKDAGITPLDPTRAEDGIAFAVTRQYAAQHHLKTLSDLGRLGRPIALAAGTPCAERDDCAKGLQSVYGIKLSRVEPLLSGSSDTLDALRRGQVQLAQVTTTDGSLAGLGVVTLRDDKSWQRAENLVPLLNTAWLDRHPRARPILNRLANVLTTADLARLNGQVDVSGRSPREVAQAYLESKGLL